MAAPDALVLCLIGACATDALVLLAIGFIAFAVDKVTEWLKRHGADPATVLLLKWAARLLLILPLTVLLVFATLEAIHLAIAVLE